jgi:hypothetical protein
MPRIRRRNYSRKRAASKLGAESISVYRCTNGTYGWTCPRGWSKGEARGKLGFAIATAELCDARRRVGPVEPRDLQADVTNSVEQ